MKGSITMTEGKAKTYGTVLKERFVKVLEKRLDNML